MNQTSKHIAHKIGCKSRTTDVAFDDFISFENLNIKPNVLTGLREAGFEKPSPIQAQAIPYGLCKLDLIIQAKAGTGKTCVFTVVVLEHLITENNNLQALILAPTREIATQICDVVAMIGKFMPGLKCHSFIGGLPVEADKKKLKKCHIAVATPGRMKQLMENKVIDFEHVRFFVLDEADRLLDSNFQDVIVWIYKNLPANKQMMTFSATYPESLANYVSKFMESAYTIRLDCEDPTLKGVMQYYRIIDNANNRSEVFAFKLAEVLKILNTVDYSQCLVFTNFQNTPESIFNFLKREGFSADFIHGDMNQVNRNSVIFKLKHNEIRILVTTDLISRGIDAEEVNLVINFDTPGEHESYLHRIGRGGRFGGYSAAITLLIETELIDLARIEKQCNSRIACLPEPLPDNLAEEKVYSNAEIPSIFHFMFNRINSESTTNSEPKTDQSEANEICDSILPVDGTPEPTSSQIIEFKRLINLLNIGGGSTRPASEMNMNEVFNDYNSIVGFENVEEGEFILKNLNTSLPCKRLDPVIISDLKKCLSSILPTGGALTKLVKKHQLGADDDLFDSLCALLPEHVVELENIFKPKGTNCDHAQNEELNVADDVHVDGENEKVNNETILPHQPLVAQQDRKKYSRDAIIFIKETMPDKYRDISHLECDMNVLLEVKKGAVSKANFGKTENRKQFNKNLPFKNGKEPFKNKMSNLKYNDIEKFYEEKASPTNLSELKNGHVGESVVPVVSENVEIISSSEEQMTPQVLKIDATEEEPTVTNDDPMPSFESLNMNQVSSDRVESTGEVNSDKQHMEESGQVTESTNEQVLEKFEQVNISEVCSNEYASSSDPSNSQVTLFSETKINDPVETSGIGLSDSVQTPVGSDMSDDDSDERFLPFPKSKKENVCSVTIASSTPMPVRLNSRKDKDSSPSLKPSSKDQFHSRGLKMSFSAANKRDVSKDSHESPKKRHVSCSAPKSKQIKEHVDQDQYHPHHGQQVFRNSLNENLQNFILKSQKMTMMARSHADYVSHMIQFNRHSHY